jgi:general stress protein 26
MRPQTMRDDAADKLWALIKDIDVAMLTTEDHGLLRSRPMATVKREFEGELWFFTRMDAHKLREIGANERVSLSYAEPLRQTYVSVSGRARLVRDKDKAEEMWTPDLRRWFPNGAEDDDVALLCVSVDEAEYWDSMSSAMTLAYGLAKTVPMSGEAELGENEKLSF